MADLIPPMLIKLQADVQDLKVGLAQAESALKGVDKSVATASTGMTNFISKMKQVGATIGIAFAGQQVLQFGKDVIMAASDMNESLSKVGVVFGESSDAVVAWSQNSAQALGISSQKALEAAGTYGNLFQAFGLGQGQAQEMSTSLVQLAADMASFNNTSIDDAILALRSGLSGETEPLKRFGVALNDVRLKEQAMSMGLIKTATGPLPIAAKAQAAYALILNDTKLAQGDYSRTADGAANTMKSLAAEFQNAKVAIGNALLPVFKALLAVLKVIVPVLTGIGKFFTENADALKMYAIILGSLVATFYAYRAALIVTNVAQQAFVVMLTILRGKTLASIASNNGLAASMLALNAAMRANPIGLIVTALTVLGAAFVWAWKKSETFRGVVIKGVQIILNWWAFLLDGVGKLAGLFSKMPGMGWAKGIADGAKKAADSIKTTSKNLSDLKSSVKSGYGEGAFTYGSGKGGGAGGGGGGGGGLDSKEKKKLEAYKKDVAGIYKDMNEVIADSQEKAQEVLDRRNEVMFKAHKDYDEKVAELNKRFKEANEEADKRFAEAKADAQKRRDKAETEAYKRNKEALESIEKDYAERKADLFKANNDKLDDIRKKAADKTADLTKAAAEKQANIVQQGVDRLRNAFASKTGFDLGEAFKGGANSADKLLADLKAKLAAAKELQANAAKLAGMGYSQVFIEEVVKQGPEAGNKLAEALKAASPEATTELQELYYGLEDVSQNGLNDLAKQMSTSTSFATEEMMNAYNQVAIDLKKSLAEVNSQMNEALAESNKAYAEAIADAEKDRTEKIASANKALTEALAEAKIAYDEALADATKALTEARERAQKDLSEGLAEAQKTLQEALLEAQKDYEKAIDEINKSTMKKIAELQAKLKEVAALMAALSKASAAAAVANAPKFTPIIATTTPSAGGNNNSTSTQTNISNTFVATKVDASDVHLATLSAIKYGQAVTVPTQSVNTTTLAGIMAASGVTSINSNGGGGGDRTAAQIA
jgi:hypothetical protein